MALESASQLSLEEKRTLSLLHKFIFFTLGLLAALTIYVLINLSDGLTAEKQREALKHFQEITSDVKTAQDLGI